MWFKKDQRQLVSNKPHLHSKTWCILPWIHAATLTDGSIQLCCVADSESDEEKDKSPESNLNQSTLEFYWNSRQMKDVRKKMMTGKAVPACRRCYEEERNGYRSHRVVENKAWRDKLGQDKIDEIVGKTEVGGHLNSAVMSIDLRLGNTCNLQCVMCQPRESSKWTSGAKAIIEEMAGNKELKSEWEYKSNIKVDLYEWYKNKNFWNNLKELLPFINEIIVGGGEPMLIKEHLEFIKFCADTGEAEHIHLRYHTNGTILRKEMIPNWAKFQCVEMFISVDGLGGVANYIRYPSRWADIEKNLDIVDSMPDNTLLRFLYSVNALNIHHIPEFLGWVKNQMYDKEMDTIQAFVHPGIVHWPLYLNPKVLPKQYKEKVTSDLEAYFSKNFPDEPLDKYRGIISLMNSEDWSHHLPNLVHYLKGLDRVRGTSYIEQFPQLAGSLSSYHKLSLESEVR